MKKFLFTSLCNARLRWFAWCACCQGFWCVDKNGYPGDRFSHYPLDLLCASDSLNVLVGFLLILLLRFILSKGQIIFPSDFNLMLQRRSYCWYIDRPRPRKASQKRCRCSCFQVSHSFCISSCLIFLRLWVLVDQCSAYVPRVTGLGYPVLVLLFYAVPS